MAAAKGHRFRRTHRADLVQLYCVQYVVLVAYTSIYIIPVSFQSTVTVPHASCSSLDSPMAHMWPCAAAPLLAVQIRPDRFIHG